jgi:hypothetical protein
MASRLVRQINRLIKTRLSQQFHDSFNFPNRIVIIILRLNAWLDNGVHDDRHRLGNSIKDDQLIHNQKIHHWSAEFILGWPWHNGFQIMDHFVGKESHSAASESRKPRNRHRSETLHNRLQHLETIPGGSIVSVA